MINIKQKMKIDGDEVNVIEVEAGIHYLDFNGFIVELDEGGTGLLFLKETYEAAEKIIMQPEKARSKQAYLDAIDTIESVNKLIESDSTYKMLFDRELLQIDANNLRNWSMIIFPEKPNGQDSSNPPPAGPANI